jgi:GT2 family glycosyltransferase
LSENDVKSYVHVVVLNWNGWANTSICLSSLQNLHYENCKVTVIDNGSTDDSSFRIGSEFPWVQVVETGKNLGFAGGCNVGIRRALAAGAQYVWLLNNDTRVDPFALNAMVNKAESDPKIGAVGSLIYFMEEKERVQAWGGGHVNFLLGRVRHFLGPVDDEKLDYVTGTSLLIRRSALESVGLLDEGFFFFWEDTDLGFRLRRMGWRLAAAGDSRIWHMESATIGKRSEHQDSNFNRSAVRFFKKNAQVPFFPIWVGIALRVAKRALTGDWKRLRAVWLGHREAGR